MTNQTRKFDHVELREFNGTCDAWAVDKDVAAYLVRDGVVKTRGSDNMGFYLSISRHPDTYEYKEIISTRSEAERKRNEFAGLISKANLRSNRQVS
jgi:hypothetical protein